MAPKTRASARADKAARDPSPPPSPVPADLHSGPPPGGIRRTLKCVLIPTRAIHADRAQKLGVTEQEYEDVVKAQQDEYDSDLDADSDDEVDEFRTLFDSATQKLRTATAPARPTVLASSSFSRSNLELVKTQWTEVFEDHGLEALATALVEEEIDARLSEKNALISTDVSWAAKAMYDVLLSMDKTLIKSIMSGNISFDKRRNPQLRAELAKIREQSKNQPSIYHQSLVDEDGLSPTPNELKEVLGWMENYMKACARDKNLPETKDLNVPPMSRNSMCEVDKLKNFVRKKFDKDKFDKMHFAKYMWHVVYVPASASASAATSAKGKGKAKAAMPSSSPAGSDYNSDDSSSAKAKQKKKQQTGPKVAEWRYCKAHVIQTKAFIRALRQRLASIDPADLDKPLQFPLVEVGYAKESIKRLSAHKSHRNSNYIMNLMDALFTLWGPKIGSGQSERPKYKIEQEVIALIWKVDQAEVSEIGLTKLAEGYIHNAGGFSHFPAGLSNDSAHRLRPKIWSAAQEWMLENTCYTSNLQGIEDDVQERLVDAQLRNANLRSETLAFAERTSEDRAGSLRDAVATLRRCREEGIELPEGNEIDDIEATVARHPLDRNDINTKLQLVDQERELVKDYNDLAYGVNALDIVSDRAKPTRMDDGVPDMEEDEMDSLIAELTAGVNESTAGWKRLKDVIGGGEF